MTRKKWHCATWRSHGLTQNCVRIDQITISYRCWGCVGNCRNLKVHLFTPTTHLHMHVYLYCSVARNVWLNFKLSFVFITPYEPPYSALNRIICFNIKNGNWMLMRQYPLCCEISRYCETVRQTAHQPWISENSTSLMRSKRLYISMIQMCIKRQITYSLCIDREQWYITRTKDLERTEHSSDVWCIASSYRKIIFIDNWIK